mmetsp:Transcript_48309/g.80307  ORF Transcript_48309/g.80307 Transcript_48309/m.80307 type:complete len:228 (+) Transcript_48309:48-731(+)
MNGDPTHLPLLISSLMCVCVCAGSTGSVLHNRDYTLIIDKSGSMSTTDVGGKARWDVMQEAAMALARKIDTLDPDGITVYLFAGSFKRFDNVKPVKVEQIFKENEPSGSTDLAKVLEHALENYFQRKRKGQTKANGETILVVTDGAPDDQMAVVQTIITATKTIDRDEELAISFIQVGRDESARRYLQLLDDDLVSAGAKFDIVDTKTLDEMEDLTLTEVLLAAVYD